MAKLIPNVNDLSTVNPRLASEWHGVKNGELLPSQVTAGSGKKVWWQCARGHEWQAIVQNRVKFPGCPICSRSKK